MVELTLKRIISTKDSTVGALMHGEKFICWTIEDGYHEVKIKGQTRIPEGRYKCKKATDTRFNTSYSIKYGWDWVMRILDVPGFEGIEIHLGNKVQDTNGCILLNSFIGYDRPNKNFYGTGSRDAMDFFYPYLNSLNDDEIYITIK